METILDLLKRVNALEAAAAKKKLDIAFSLEEDQVGIRIFTYSCGVLDYVYKDERRWSYCPGDREPEKCREDLAGMLNKAEAFLQRWTGKTAAKLKKEIVNLQAKLEAKRAQLEEITEDAE